MPWRTELISIATGTELVGADRSSMLATRRAALLTWRRPR
jgi:hypothetical protein